VALIGALLPENTKSMISWKDSRQHR